MDVELTPLEVQNFASDPVMLGLVKCGDAAYKLDRYHDVGFSIFVHEPPKLKSGGLNNLLTKIKISSLFADSVIVGNAPTYWHYCQWLSRNCDPRLLVRMVPDLCNSPSLNEIAETRGLEPVKKWLDPEKPSSERNLVYLTNMQSELRNAFGALPSEQLLAELNLLVEAGLVSLCRYPISPSFSDAIENDMHHLISASVSPRTGLLFDQEWSNGYRVLADTLRRGDEVENTDSAVQRSLAVLLGATLLANFPEVESLPAKDIIAIRKQLDSHLVPLRAYLLELSTQLKAKPWEQNVHAEMELTLNKIVLPEIEKLSRELKRISRLRATVEGLLTADSTSSSVLGFAVASAGVVPSYVGGVAAVLGASRSVYQKLREEQVKLTQVHDAQLYFVCQAKTEAQRRNGKAKAGTPSQSRPLETDPS